MVGTRSREESKKRPSRRSLVDEPISLNAPPPSYAFGDGFLPSTGGTSTVALTVSGHWNPPPTIGEIEAVLMAKGRAQHRICRIEVRADCAIVEVHPDDVPNCIGLLDLGDIQLNVSVAGMGMGIGSGIGLGFELDQPLSGLGCSLGMDTGVDLSHSPPPPPPPPPPANKKRAKIEPEKVAPPPSADQVMPPSEDLMAPSTLMSVVVPEMKREASMDSSAGPLSAATKERLREEEKQRRVYRVGLSYRCGRCGKPKKGHVCDIPEGEEGSMAPFGDGQSLSPQPAILATTVRKGTPPCLLGSPLAASPAHRVACAEVSPQSVGGKVEVSGEASTIFKDMVAALGDSTALCSPNATHVSSPGAPPQMVTAVGPGISPLAVSAIAAGSVSSAAAPVMAASATSASSICEPQLSDMDMMLADLAFAARPPPVMTPDEGGAEQVANGLGSLSPSNFSPGTMIQQLIATPGGTSWSNAGLGLDAALLGQVPLVASARRATVMAQPTA